MEHARALHFVLVSALDRETVMRCLGATEGHAWSGTIYARAAATALRSPTVWRRLRDRVDEALAPWTSGFRNATPEERTAWLGSSAASGWLTAEESAAAIWCGLREQFTHA
ncbi:MAG: hypothetical protein AB8I08_08215 [Sandaracinaceae bacterium]